MRLKVTSVHGTPNIERNLACSVRCGMKLLNHSQTSTVSPLMFRNGQLIPYQSLQTWKKCLHFTDYSLKRIFFNENISILILIKLKFVKSTVSQRWLVWNIRQSILWSNFDQPVLQHRALTMVIIILLVLNRIDFNTLRPRQNGRHLPDDIFRMKMYKFQLRFYCSWFPSVQLTIFQHWFREWLGADQATSHYLNQW